MLAAAFVTTAAAVAAFDLAPEPKELVMVEGQGSFFPSSLERRRRIDRAISKSEVSRICSDSTGTCWRSGTGRWITPSPVYVCLDATYVKGRVRDGSCRLRSCERLVRLLND